MSAGPIGQSLRKPPWIRVKVGYGPGFVRMSNLIHDRKLHTVCEQAVCPNRGTCWEHGRATIMILGGTCTRGCGFCGVQTRRPEPCDPGEPTRVAEAVKAMGLRDVVITSVTRDDLDDGGAAIWAETVRLVREAVPGILIEVLVPDFAGSRDSLAKVLAEGPAVCGHNLEVVPSLYSSARPTADYGRSLDLLRWSHESGSITKTSIMVGLGEREDEVVEVMRDTRGAGCEIFYIGQYLQPTKQHLPVREYVEPVVFERYKETGIGMGFPVLVSAPLVRSSYHSEEQAEFVRAKLCGAPSP